MPRSKSFFRRVVEGGEAMFFPSETKMQNSSKYKAHDVELKSRLEDLRIKHRDFIRKMHTEVLELKQFLNEVQQCRPAAADLKRIDRRHRRRRMIAQTETEMVKVRVENQVINLPVLVLKKKDKSEEKTRGKRGHSRDRSKHRRSSKQNLETRRDKNNNLLDSEANRSKDPLPELPEEPPIPQESKAGQKLPNVESVKALTSSLQESRMPTLAKERSDDLLSKRERARVKLRRPSSLPDLFVVPKDLQRHTEKA